MTTTVVLSRCASYEDRCVRAAIEDVLEPLGGIGAFVSPGTRVLLKPNLIVARHQDQAATTHPAVMKVVAQMVVEAGAMPIIGDSPAFGSARGVAARSGIMKIAREMGIEIVEFRNPQRIWLGRGSLRSILVDRLAFEADAIINLPKLKIHGQMMLSLAVKNLFGFVPGRRKALCHLLFSGNRKGFARLILEIMEHVQPQLTIVDGIVGMEGDGPSNGDPRGFGLVAAGTDCVAIDTVLAEVLGIQPRDVPILEVAHELGVGETRLDRIAILGEQLDSIRVSEVWVPALSPIGFSVPRLARGMVKHCMALMRARRAEKPSS
jgi:uncharacterized protein (DUF362 family)